MQWLDVFCRYGQVPPSPRIPSRIVSLLLPILLLACVSCRPKITEQGKRQLRSAADLIDQGSYVVSADELNSFLQAFPSSDEVGEALYMIGLCRVNLGQPDRAQRDFQLALPAADVPVLEHYLRLSLANLAFERQDYPTAGEFYGPYLDSLPHRPPFDLAYYRYGLTLQANGRWKQADVQFSRILRIFPEADILPSVRKHFGWSHYAIELGRFDSFELAQRQRREFPDLADQLHCQTQRGPDGWQYVNLYGEFSDLERAKDALGKITPRAAQARIVP